MGMWLTNEERRAIDYAQVNCDENYKDTEITIDRIDVECLLNLIKKLRNEVDGLQKSQCCVDVIKNTIEALFTEMNELDPNDEDYIEDKRQVADIIVVLKRILNEVEGKD